MAVGKEIVTWVDGQWHRGNAPIIGAADHAAWLGSQVFDGARQFEGVRPDLDLHAARIIRSAEVMNMLPPVDAATVQGLMEEGCGMFAPHAALYLRPMMWSRESSPGIIDATPESTGFAICIESLAMPDPGEFSLTVSPYCRPRPDMALTEAKAGALYANNARIMADARKRGFSNALSLDVNGHVAETASTNVFMVRDGVVLTPAPNGMFLNGITRQRVIGLLRADGLDVIETSLTLTDFDQAEEIFVTGNIAKVMPVTRYQDRELGKPKIGLRARELYWDYALSARV
ncbi:branched-chain amino acid aminotransferase [Roseinatronobacter bogoriensis]|uniref:Probable branched-chain-amino-acid aminotransferase n=1 Tax=Roseinatronobacter bogoriensis subsp. barguzinensis TaxID=441209 RepID=A0A2K8KGK5_9RHOB|nr:MULTISPECIES: branched-chain amino acid aminotransferase [Rhodobaca]ATX65928.1 branched chain amino acid aminotransferase [Rhodobaca barguzinensis]MBB4208096.1 branched-chain amino acid aminotransferase [Rhodobaca bogoriensis DSM 18756]TDW38736.1 branched-chain amino acid aminotransferase [Rhodobaca barguzinensis]TDY69226.1 branched-chain amino acid aminotransferase [Rhodobaca bogoriensis DSM 18756]